MLPAKITKSDFLLFCEAPRHLWARKNGKIQRPTSDFDQHLAAEGYAVERLAQDYFHSVFLPQNPASLLLWQQTYTDGPFEARLDMLVYRPDPGVYDLYEIKSATGVDRSDLFDVAYQALVLSSQVPLERCFLLHLNKEYIHSGELDLARLFSAEDVTGQVAEMLPALDGLRQDALLAAQASSPASLPTAFPPGNAPARRSAIPGCPISRSMTSRASARKRRSSCSTWASRMQRIFPHPLR